MSVGIETPTLFGVSYRDDAVSGNGSGRISGHSPEISYRLVIEEALVNALNDAGMDGRSRRDSPFGILLPSFGADSSDGFERQIRSPPAMAVTPL